MAKQKAEGRMINKDISNSDGFASLSPQAAVLFCMLIPHLNSYGKMNGGPGFVKEIVCFKISYLPQGILPDLLKEISEHTNVKWFKHDGRFWIHSINFLSSHQRLEKSRLGQDLLPTYSGPTPDLVVPEVEVEVEVEGKGSRSLVETSYEPDLEHLDLLSQNAFSQVLQLYPEAGKQVGIADGQAARIFAKEISVSEHGPLIKAVKNLASEVESEGTAPQYVKRLVNFLRDGYWKNYIDTKPIGTSPSRAAPDYSWKDQAEKDEEMFRQEQRAGPKEIPKPAFMKIFSEAE